MYAYGIYEGAGQHGGEYEPVIVTGYTDAAGHTLDAGLLPHERAQEAAYVIVLRNAGAGARHLVEAGRLHASELGSCDVVVREVNAGPILVCRTCSERSAAFIAGLVDEVTA